MPPNLIDEQIAAEFQFSEPIAIAFPHSKLMIDDSPLHHQLDYCEW
jgi:hypothetical protein